jgi:hypothetical protein
MGGERPQTSALEACDKSAPLSLIEAILASTSSRILSRPPAVEAETAQRQARGIFFPLLQVFGGLFAPFSSLRRRSVAKEARKPNSISLPLRAKPNWKLVASNLDHNMVAKTRIFS